MFFLVPIHRHPLAAPAHFAIRLRADGPAATAGTSSRRTILGHAPAGAAFLERQQLSAAVCLIVGLSGSLNEILQMRLGEEAAQVDKFAMRFVVDIDDTPAILARSALAAVDEHCLLRTHDGKGDETLEKRKNHQHVIATHM